MADALRHPAMDLALQRQPVDDSADIVDDDVAQHLGRSGLGIDLDFADVAAVGEVGDLRREARDLVEPGFEPLRQAGRLIGRLGHLLERDGAVGPDDAEEPAENSISASAASIACAAILRALAMILSAAIVAALPPSTAVREA